MFPDGDAPDERTRAKGLRPEPPLEFRVLGPLEIQRDGTALPLGGRRRRALLALLLVRANEAVPTDRIADELWPAGLPATARAVVHNHVSALRRLIGRGRLVTEAAGYRLVVAPGELDAERIERALTTTRDAEPLVRAQALRSALAAWRGPPLVEFAEEPFAQEAIVRLEQLRQTAIDERMAAEIAAGRGAHVVPESIALVQRNPLRERSWELLMLSLYGAGRRCDALTAFRRAREVLRERVGLEPGASLRALQRAMLDDAEGVAAPYVCTCGRAVVPFRGWTPIRSSFASSAA